MDKALIGISLLLQPQFSQDLTKCHKETQASSSACSSVFASGHVAAITAYSSGPNERCLISSPPCKPSVQPIEAGLLGDIPHCSLPRRSCSLFLNSQNNPILGHFLSGLAFRYFASPFSFKNDLSFFHMGSLFWVSRWNVPGSLSSVPPARLRKQQPSHFAEGTSSKA